jgi:hypothetical protein
LYVKGMPSNERNKRKERKKQNRPRKKETHKNEN